jgi:hypothetical protein
MRNECKRVDDVRVFIQNRLDDAVECLCVSQSVFESVVRVCSVWSVCTYTQGVGKRRNQAKRMRNECKRVDDVRHHPHSTWFDVWMSVRVRFCV